MLNTLGRRMDEHRNNFSKELEHIKKNQTEVKNTINEKKMYTRRNQEQIRLYTGMNPQIGRQHCGKYSSGTENRNNNNNVCLRKL